MGTTIGFREQFQANPARGVLTGERLAHWNTLLEEWCKIHERYRLALGEVVESVVLPQSLKAGILAATGRPAGLE